ncbi:hypothetical protein QJS10_CPA03g00170 [Acorus calamus]|uniref:Ubiquitin-like domain-containing protein n=1 Tax=Acorus calamus TaxID=4465 RepID=A0AAV9F4B2_ACOCL|nr:hypothetical protein QJS10_CPA03g00170 [Acorus calamus]
MATQVFVRLIDGHTRCVSFPSHSISGETLKRRLSDITDIPPSSQRLVSGTLEIHDETLISDSGFPPTFHLLLRLRGGKGGFGSLLRGAGTKAGQKKTSNFDACRDMSGRRIRHVNAEKRLEEWREGAGERKLERIAEEEELERCAGGVEEAVRESFKLYEEQKRKALPASGSASKRLKLWLGKQKLEETDSEEEDEDADRKSVVTDGEGTSGSGLDGPKSWLGEQNSDENGNNKDEDSDEGNGKSVLTCSWKSTIQSNEREGCSDLVSGSNLGGISLGEGSSQSDLDDCVGSVAEETKVFISGAVVLEVDGLIGTQSSVHDENPVGKITHVSDPERSLDSTINDVAGNCSIAPQPEIQDEQVTESASVLDAEKPLNFDEYSAAAELEDLGMERLKKELQTRGLKCGGTLHERAERLFLLKTTPIDMLPKKVLAKPRS